MNIIAKVIESMLVQDATQSWNGRSPGDLHWGRGGVVEDENIWGWGGAALLAATLRSDALPSSHLGSRARTNVAP